MCILSPETCRSAPSSTICGSLFWLSHFHPPGAPHTTPTGTSGSTQSGRESRAILVSQSLAFKANLDWPLLCFHPTGGEGLKTTAQPQSNQCKSELKMTPSKTTNVKDEWVWQSTLLLGVCQCPGVISGEKAGMCSTPPVNAMGHQAGTGSRES